MRPLIRPFRPVDLTETDLESFELDGLARQLMAEPQFEKEGRAAVTLVRDAHLSVVLVALRSGSELREHRAPASALVTLRSGRATFLSEPGSARTEMVPGTLVAFSAGLDHALVAGEDCVLLIAIGGRAPQG